MKKTPFSTKRTVMEVGEYTPELTDAELPSIDTREYTPELTDSELPFIETREYTQVQTSKELPSIGARDYTQVTTDRELLSIAHEYTLVQTDSELPSIDAFLLYDDNDEDKASLISEKLENNGISWSSLTPGRSALSTFKDITSFAKKLIFIFSVFSSKNELFEYGLSMLLLKIPRKNFITVDVSNGESIKDEFNLLQLTTVIRSSSNLWLDDLVQEIYTTFPSYTNILSKGSVIDNLMFQGLCIQHMQSNILGILVMADKMCLQVDLKEYLIHQQTHHAYKTASVLQEFRNLRNIDANLIVILRDDVKNRLENSKEDIALLASSVIDTSIEKARCDWSIACTVKGNYGEEEQNFLSCLYPYITYTLMNKFVETVNEPFFPQYQILNERIESFPINWREKNMDEIRTISEAGFFYAGYGETGRCFHCACVLTNIRAQYSALLQHAARFPACKYVGRNVDKEIIYKASKEFIAQGSKSKTAEAYKKMYESFDARMKTFESYEQKNNKTDVDFNKLVEAGFYYIGLENLIQCYACSVRVYGIESSQSAWSVHVHLSPKCSHVLKEKGEQFILEQQTAKRQTLNEDYAVISFLRKTSDGTKRRNWPKNMFRPW